MTVPTLVPASCNASSEDDQQVLGQYIPLLYHYNMLQDEDRVGAFRKAIELIVKPNMHVVELGGGTGILSSFAARQGAVVSCVESNPELVACARRLVQANGLQKHITVIQADAANYVPKHAVDVVVCEMLHVGLLREKQVEVISAFKRNYGRAYGSKLPIFIPEATILMAQPVDQSFDFSGYLAPIPMFQAPLLDQPRTTELADLFAYASIAYHEPIPNRFSVHQTLKATRTGKLNAIRLVTQNVLAIDMCARQAITWPNQCLVLPVDAPFDLRQQDHVTMQFDYDAGSSVASLMQRVVVSLDASEQFGGGFHSSESGCDLRPLA